MDRMYDILPIKTMYDGTLFRSRLEARWACFFKEAGIQYQYEPDVFLTRHGLYCPDFYLPELELYLEIKPTEPTPVEEDKLADINAKATFRIGMPSNDLDNHMTTMYFGGKGTDSGSYLFCVCNECGKLGFEFNGRGDRVCRHSDNDKGYSYENERFVKAILVSNSISW